MVFGCCPILNRWEPRISCRRIAGSPRIHAQTNRWEQPHLSGDAGGSPRIHAGELGFQVERQGGMIDSPALAAGFQMAAR